VAYNPANLRIPVLMAEVTWVLEAVSLTGVWVPFFVPHQMSLAEGDFAPFGPATPLNANLPIFSLLSSAVHPSVLPGLEEHLLVTKFPEALPENMSGGARVAGTVAGVDLGVGYFYGWDRNATFSMHPAFAAFVAAIAADPQFLRDFDFAGLITRNPDILGLQQELSAAAQSGQPLFSSIYQRRHHVEADLVTYLGPLGLRLEAGFIRNEPCT
jgi:hypothetical protein